MIRLAVGAALLALCSSAGVSRAAEPDQPADKPVLRAPWYKRMFGIGPDPVKVAPAPRRNPAREAAADRALAEADLERRMRVCDELRRIADAKNDNDLWAKAEELDRQAWDVYKLATAHLPCSRLVATHDERSLDRHLGGDESASADKLMTPAISVPNRKAQASALREIKP